MYKRYLPRLLVAVAFGVASAAAQAVPFSIIDSSLDYTVSDGYLPSVTYTPNLSIPQFDLQPGESSGTITFGTVYIPIAIDAQGDATFTVTLAQPVSDDISDSGSFDVWAFFVVATGSLTWGEPVAVDFVWNNMPGTFTLDLDDLDGTAFGTFAITGTISLDSIGALAEVAGVAVPEPSPLVLLGAGLLGLAFVRRRLA